MTAILINLSDEENFLVEVYKTKKRLSSKSKAIKSLIASEKIKILEEDL